MRVIGSIFLLALLGVPSADGPAKPVPPSLKVRIPGRPSLRKHDVRKYVERVRLARILWRSVVVIKVESLPPSGFSKRFRQVSYGFGVVVPGSPVLVLTTAEFNKRAVSWKIKYGFPPGKQRLAEASIISRSKYFSLLMVRNKALKKFARPAVFRRKPVSPKGEDCFSLLRPESNPGQLQNCTVWRWTESEKEDSGVKLPYTVTSTLRYERGLPLFDDHGRLVAINAKNSPQHKYRCMGYGVSGMRRFLSSAHLWRHPNLKKKARKRSRKKPKGRSVRRPKLSP